MRISIVFVLLIAGANATTSKPCADFSPSPIAFLALPAYFPHQRISKLTDLADIEEIRQIISQYAFSIDGRDFDALSEVFAMDAVADYSAPLGVLNGLAAIETTLSAALSQFPSTQHQLGTQRIRLCEKNTAISATYYRAAHYLNATGGALHVIDDSGVLIAYSQYQDSWIKRNGTWKIVYRNNVYMVSACAGQIACNKLTLAGAAGHRLELTIATRAFETRYFVRDARTRMLRSLMGIEGLIAIRGHACSS